MEGTYRRKDKDYADPSHNDYSSTLPMNEVFGISVIFSIWLLEFGIIYPKMWLH